MAIFTTSQTTGFTLTGPGITDIVAAGITISDSANDAARSSDDNSHLVNYGSLLSAALGHAGVYFEKDAGSILNAATGVVAGRIGVDIDGDDDSLTNDGLIEGTSIGVLLDINSDNAHVLNHGYIHGGLNGIAADSNTDGALINNAGTVDSDFAGIFVDTHLGALTTTIINTGTIHGSFNAIRASAGAFSLANQGTLIGDVVSFAAAAADTIVNAGKIMGDVHLGAGGDTFNGVGGASGSIYGEAGADRLIGGSSGDRMDGGDGSDTLTGGAGADHFLFSTALVANVDRITDFKHGVDKFDLDHVIFGAAGAAGTGLSAAAFFKGAHAHDASDRIIYNPANGFVLYDSNGSGAGHEVHFATLAHNLALSQLDFLIT